MKTLHANKDYVLHNEQVYFITDEPIQVGEHLMCVLGTPYVDRCTEIDVYDDYLTNYNGNLIKWTSGKHVRKITASTDKSLPVKHIDRSVFVKPVDFERLCIIEAEERGLKDYDPSYDVFIDGCDFGYNSNANQFTLEEMKNLWRLKGNETVNFDHAMELIRPLSLPETIQCDDNYENLKPIWKQIN